MAYHAHDDENKILICPDCSSSLVHPVTKTDTMYNGHYKGMVKSLYNENNPEDYGNNFHEDYNYKYGHKPLKRQHHFFCEPCMDYYLDDEVGWNSEPDYLPIYSYKDMKKMDMKHIQEPPNENPWDSVFNK